MNSFKGLPYQKALIVLLIPSQHYCGKTKCEQSNHLPHIHKCLLSITFPSEFPILITLTV
jgi:hypothetical protein